MSTFGIRKGPKNNDRRRGVPAQRKAQRHLEAQVRQAQYDKLTLSQKMELVASRPGNNAREIARLARKVKQ